MELAKLIQEAGFPDGVVNIVPGYGETAGAALASHPGIDKIAFTGSTEVGKIIAKTAAENLTKVSLELGGKAPNIVFADADIDQAVNGAMMGIFFNQGQVCCAGSRIFLDERVKDEFLDRFKTKAEGVKVGNPMDRNNQVGPLARADLVDDLERQVNESVQLGARAVVGGKRIEGNGYYFEPTVLTNVTAEMLVSHEETFGPVAPLIRFKTEDEVIALANNSEFGLAGYFYSRDLGRIWRVAEAMETGMVGVNAGIISTEVAPFGGVKQSGLGREGSKYGIDEFLEIKYILLGGIQ
jgi:acyl-CoA reductase-like NAD-dependent aldehyde dehydrogenase